MIGDVSGEPVDWEQWYMETLQVLVDQIAAAEVEWAEDPEGDPWIIVGDRESTGMEYPACFVVSFSDSRDNAKSDRDDEWRTISSQLLVLNKGDTKDPQASLTEALRMIGRVKNSLYENRHLDRTCERLAVEDTTPFAGAGADSHLLGGEINLQIRKQAQLYKQA